MNVRLRRWVSLAAMGLLTLTATPVAAQTSQGWEVNFAPLYLWASELDGKIRVNDATVPVFMTFGDAAGNLAGIFTFHLEARKGRWGMLSDLGFVRLSTTSTFSLPPVLPAGPGRSVTADLTLDNIVFEVGGSYLVLPKPDFSVIGGVRTYTMSPKIEFAPGSLSVALVDASHTAVNGFVGALYRPRLSDKWYFVSRADIGGGEGTTWSGTVALQYQFNRRSGILFGYHALGIDAGDAGTAAMGPASSQGGPAVDYDVTHYGPIVALNLRWGGR